MINGRKNNLKDRTALILSVWLLILLLTSVIRGNYSSPPVFYNSLTAYNQPAVNKLLIADTIPVRDSIHRRNRFAGDTLPGNRSNPNNVIRNKPVPSGTQDTTLKRTDTIPGRDSLVNQTDTFNVKMSGDTLDAPITYKASDSMVLMVPEKKIILFSKGNVKYKDIDLSADSIEIDQSTQMVTATWRRDTAGSIVGKPLMLQADSKMSADVIKYNFKSQKGLTQNTITQQGEMYVQGEKVKKINEREFFAYRSQFTTCNLDTPHFAFRANKLKMVSQKLAISGPIHPEFEGVPVPLYLPFGYFPISQGRHSGLLPPQFTASDQFGLGLEGLGYYKVLNEYFDVTLRTNLYSYGGYSLFVTPSYRKRYRYNGSMNIVYQQSRILSNSAKEEFTNTKTYNLTWSHTVDSRARPGQSFSANVNVSSTKFNQLVPNNQFLNYQNNLNSSISYSKTWGTKYNLTATANHNQNNNTRLISLSLPNVAFTANTMYPLQPKDYAGVAKWYHKLGIGLSSNVANQINFLEEDFSFRKILDTMQWGAQHSIPIQLSLPPMGPLQIAPGISYQQKWYSRKLFREYNPTTHRIDSTLTKGFYAAHDISFSLGVSTALFGMFDKFGKNSPVKAIRHVIRPTISASYKPDLGKQYYQTLRIDSAGHEQRVSFFDGSTFGGFGEGEFGGISFGIDNNIEAKVRSKKDTTNGGIKKIRLIDGFGFNSSYNLMADSFKLAPFSLYVRSTLFEKVNITAGATLDPYQVDGAGFAVDKYAWEGKKFSLNSLGRITNGNIAVSTSFQSKATDKEKAQQKEEALNSGVMTPEEQQMQMAYVRQNPAEFADFNVPWSLSISYSLSFSRIFRSDQDFQGFETNTYSNFSWNGDFNLTPKWKLGMNGYYDFKTSAIQTFTMYISREMHCWQLSINVTPVGLYRTFNITISPKSGILRDLKVNRTRYFYGM
jgi:LPS-assembly protein